MTTSLFLRDNGEKLLLANTENRHSAEEENDFQRVRYAHPHQWMLNGTNLSCTQAKPRTSQSNSSECKQIINNAIKNYNKIKTQNTTVGILVRQIFRHNMWSCVGKP